MDHECVFAIGPWEPEPNKTNVAVVCNLTNVIKFLDFVTSLSATAFPDLAVGFAFDHDALENLAKPSAAVCVLQIVKI